MDALAPTNALTLGLGATAEVGLEGQHRLGQRGVAGGEDADGEQARVARVAD